MHQIEIYDTPIMKREIYLKPQMPIKVGTYASNTYQNRIPVSKVIIPRKIEVT